MEGSGSLYITPRPRGGDWLEDDVRVLGRHGVGIAVSLLREDEQVALGLEHEAAACARQNIEFVSLPVEDRSAPDDAGEFIQAVHRLTQLVREGRIIAIHCRQSVGRAGLLAVSIAVASGVPLQDALEAVSRARGVPVPETTEQLGWLQRNVDRLSRRG